jgi:hypothetical protein
MSSSSTHGTGATPPGRGSHRFLTTRTRGVLTAAAVLAVGLAIPATSFADSAGGCDFAPNGTTVSCLGPLTGSTFAGGDGNLLASPATFGATDWQNVASRSTGVDQPSGTTDNSFGQGTKEDNANVTVVSGSIPPNKSDLTRFYEASEFANGSNFLYLAWERSNILGSANMDFEINQATTPSLGTPGSHTIVRTAGDLLVTFDFTNGGGRPTLGLLRWVTTGSTSQCFSGSSLPCWGNHENLTGAVAEGAVNNFDAVTDPFQPGTNNIPASTFGEAAINLTTAGVFPSGTCEAFGSAFVKSRASSSFSAEVKDFVAPVNVNISNCGTIVIHKVTENGDATFGYTTTGGLSPATFNLSNGGTRTYGPGTVLPGPYTVTESTVPGGWTLKNLVCTSTGSGTSASTSLATATASITMAPQGLVDCTYTNHTNVAPSIATTLSATTASIGQPVHDSATLSGATADAGGTVTYTVYTDNACTQNPQGAGTVTVTNGTVPNSNAITFTHAGTFYWQAAYSGDANNNGATSSCTSEQLVVGPNSPTISTTLSASTAKIGDQVHDSATLAGATSDAGGTVTYTVYSDSACTLNAQGAGTVTVTNGAVPDSSAITFTRAGSFFWQAVYSGDANNNGATSSCTSEQLVVIPNSPTISTTLSASTAKIGDQVHDSATLAGATSDAGGTVTYTVYSDSACTLNPQGAGTVTVTNGAVPDSSAITFTSAGTFFWQALYSGDANNNPAASPCTSEPLVVSPNAPGISTAQHLIPNDDATITGATSDAGGTITFNLFDPADATCSGTPALTQTVNVNGSGTYKTTNATFIASADGTWRWQVTYSGDSNNTGTSSSCGVESFTIKNS